MTYRLFIIGFGLSLVIFCAVVVRAFATESLPEQIEETAAIMVRNIEHMVDLEKEAEPHHEAIERLSAKHKALESNNARHEANLRDWGFRFDYDTQTVRPLPRE